MEFEGRSGDRREPRPILVVDDDADLRAAIADVLAAKGYAVVVACDGQDALELLEAGLRPSVIVLDLAMPRMDGWAFLRHLRGPAHSTVAVLVASADVRPPPPPGADAYLEKPLGPEELCAMVGRLSARSAKERG